MQVENYTSQAKSNAGTTQDKESGGERQRERARIFTTALEGKENKQELSRKTH